VLQAILLHIPEQISRPLVEDLNELVEDLLGGSSLSVLTNREVPWKTKECPFS